MNILLEERDPRQTKQYLAHANNMRTINDLIVDTKCLEDRPLRLFLVVRPESQSVTIHQEKEPDLETFAAPNDKVEDLSIPV